MFYVRWVTWWPAPYWIDRFNRLASYDGLKLEVCFLSAGSKLQGWVLDDSTWKFQHVIMNSTDSSSGYFGFQPSNPRPWPLIKRPLHALVMTYGDSSCITAAGICSILRIPYFLVLPNTKKDIRKISQTKEFLKRILFKHAKGVLAAGPAQVEYALEYVDDSQNIFTVGNPSQYFGDLVYKSLPKRQEWRQELRWDNQLVLLYVGRLSPEKGLSTLFSALEMVYGTGIRPILVLVGSGPLEHTLRQEASQRGLKVVFTGFCQREELAKYYRASDIFVLPSQSEPWGLVVNEAMEFGLPLILSSHVGCVPSLLKEGENGMMFSSGDEKTLAVCIGRLAREENLRRRMGEASTRIVQNHSLDHWCEAVLSAIKPS
jgi:glycosyltransferase involved in cell wall biosynthesis